ncbi:MAG: SCP2 sterol-binding domain-containing protein [Deltaproteobacteria bacterium]|nr:SCP2 sterol-binding domain-containing protein [Deltaproteobacteria bacterium]
METTELLTKAAVAPLKFIPRSLQCIGLGSFLAFELERDPSIRERLREIDGKTFMFEATDIDKRFYMSIKDGKVTVRPNFGGVPDVTMKGETAVLAGLMLNRVDHDTVFFSRKLQITGSTEVALWFKNILASL